MSPEQMHLEKWYERIRNRYVVRVTKEDIIKVQIDDRLTRICTVYTIFSRCSRVLVASTFSSDTYVRATELIDKAEDREGMQNRFPNSN